MEKSAEYEIEAGCTQKFRDCSLHARLGDLVRRVTMGVIRVIMPRCGCNPQPKPYILNPKPYNPKST